MSKEQQPENQRNLAYYCQRFSELNVNTSEKRGDAPYKPILLLSIIELIGRGLIKDNRITITDELTKTFNKYRQSLSDGSFKSSLSLPFFHLTNEDYQFWHLDYNSKYDYSPQTNEKIRKSIKQLREYVNYAYIDRELFELIQDQDSRKELVDTIISAWFSLSQNKLEDILQVNQKLQDSFQKELEKLEKSAEQKALPSSYLHKVSVRNAFFRKAVVHIYDYKCAFCGLKVRKKINQNIVDGAHIKPFAKFYDSRINNGLSLCKNHHWAFDHGWFCIDNTYKILIASDLEEDSPNAKPMKAFQGEFILLPTSSQYFPSIDALQWHRQNVFRA
ncbi:MAG TPA: HNH endonuclease [Cyanobacteria bacterium UBA12227]|nr:HNH endonuclease [Cyanobacteria bacterium UBA12227]HAX85934.1 HNH endonuclease [Cyanobacteria bacterium UBA11370]HBY78830.1 HNH endonuclease [Cyanobacteria bacterium UBA11148]